MVLGLKRETHFLAKHRRQVLSPSYMADFLMPLVVLNSDCQWKPVGNGSDYIAQSSDLSFRSFGCSFRIGGANDACATYVESVADHSQSQCRSVVEDLLQTGLSGVSCLLPYNLLQC
jgi:hypothetical protein